MAESFVKLKRSDATLELLRDPNAFVMLTVIALWFGRAAGFDRHGLQADQAPIGDCKVYDPTTQKCHRAKAPLQRSGLIDFKATSRGTVATLLDRTIYDVNVTDQQQTSNEQPTGGQQTSNERATTNKKVKKEKKEKKEKKHLVNSVEFTLSRLLFDLVRARKEDFRRGDLQRRATPSRDSEANLVGGGEFACFGAALLYTIFFGSF